MTTSGGNVGSGVERAHQRIRTGALDSDIDKPADQIRPTIEVDELVVAVAAGNSWRTAVVRRRRSDLIDQNLRRASDPGIVGLAADALLEIEQRLKPALLLGARHIVVESRRRSAGPDGERRRKDCLETDLAQQRQRVLELRFSLATEAHDHIRRKGDARYRCPSLSTSRRYASIVYCRPIRRRTASSPD